MEQPKEITSFLNILNVPAFSVCNGIVESVNPQAAVFLLEPGTPLVPMLVTGEQEYRALAEEAMLYLTLRLLDADWGASVIRNGQRYIFLLDQQRMQDDLQAYALASQQLRAPLSNIMLMSERLFSGADFLNSPERQDYACRLNRSLYQMLRMVSNMSDADRYCSGEPQMEVQDVNAFISEIFEKAAALEPITGIRVKFTGTDAPVYTLIDREKLERGIYNALSNSIKFSAPGSEIHANLAVSGSYLHLTIADSGAGIPENLRSNVFSRYSRMPTVEDPRYGIGLGILFIRTAAAVHGGTVLIEQPASGGTRINMTLKITKPHTVRLRSPVLRVDYAGERDHCMMELSDALPAAAYDEKNLK